MENCIFGIKCNGVSIQVTEISIDEEQSMYDYICNVSLKQSYNGNGTYDISIVNKDYEKGMPIGKWRIKKAWIWYDWNKSCAKLIMEDSDGNETCNLEAGVGAGSTKNFNIASLARTIFIKAKEIVGEYPNAEVCNAVAELEASKNLLNIDYLKQLLNSKAKEDEKYISNIEYVLSKLAKHLERYKSTKELLSNEDTIKCKSLLKKITSECKQMLLDLNL